MELGVIYDINNATENDTGSINDLDIYYAVQRFETKRRRWNDETLNDFDETVLDLMLAGF